MKIGRLVALAAVVFAPFAAAAADLPVTYTVEEKPLKAAVAGTPLTFELYTDAACSGPVAHSQVVNIENTKLLVKIKPFNPKNAAKKTNTVEVRADAEAVAALDGNPTYLKVIGTGVVPVGGACQPQSAQTQAILPAVTAVIAKSSTSGQWMFEDNTVAGTTEPAGLLSVDESASVFLAELNPNTRYSCALRMQVSVSYVNARDNVAYVPLHGVNSCTPCANPFPGCL